MYLSKFPELYGLQESPCLETGFHQVDMPGVCFSTQLATCLHVLYDPPRSSADLLKLHTQHYLILFHSHNICFS